MSIKRLISGLLALLIIIISLSVSPAVYAEKAQTGWAEGYSYRDAENNLCYQYWFYDDDGERYTADTSRYYIDNDGNPHSGWLKENNYW